MFAFFKLIFLFKYTETEKNVKQTEYLSQITYQPLLLPRPMISGSFKLNLSTLTEKFSKRKYSTLLNHQPQW